LDVNTERQRLAQTVGQQNQNAFSATSDTILASNQKSQSSAQSKRPDNQSSNVSNKKKDNSIELRYETELKQMTQIRKLFINKIIAIFLHKYFLH
jgi:hypothetical protein